MEVSRDNWLLALAYTNDKETLDQIFLEALKNKDIKVWAKIVMSWYLPLLNHDLLKLSVWASLVRLGLTARSSEVIWSLISFVIRLRQQKGFAEYKAFFRTSIVRYGYCHMGIKEIAAVLT